MTSLPLVHSTPARQRLATFAVLATAAATALAAFGSLPVMAQPAPQTPAALTAPAQAQPTPARPLHLRAAPQREQMQQQHREQRMERWQQRRTERMAAFKTQLQLTPAQEQAWTDFTAAMQPGQRHARLGREGMDNLTTPERIDRMRAVRIQRAAEADQRGDAVKTFYAALSAPQQTTFDQQMQRMQMRMHKSRDGGPGAKYQRGDKEAQGAGAYGARHRGEHHGMYQRNQHSAEGMAPSAAALPAAPAMPAQ